MTRQARSDAPPGYVSVQLPMAALTVVSRGPRLVSQRTSEEVLGMPRTHFLATCRAFEATGGEVIRDRRLVLVEVEPFVAWLKARTRADAARAKANADEADGAADDLAAELGLRVVGGAP